MSDHDDDVTRVRAALGDEFAYEPAAAAAVAMLSLPAPQPPAIAPAPGNDGEPIEAGPLPPPPRKYQRPAAYWADRWITLRKP